MVSPVSDELVCTVRRLCIVALWIYDCEEERNEMWLIMCPLFRNEVTYCRCKMTGGLEEWGYGRKRQRKFVFEQAEKSH